MKVSLILAITLVLMMEITARKLNFTRLALQPCEVCRQAPSTLEMHRDRLFEVTISTQGNIANKNSILMRQDRTVRGVLIAPKRILTTADYFVDDQTRFYYAYYGYLEALDDEEELQEQKVIAIYKHPLYMPGQDEFNIAVSKVGKEFKRTFAYISDECIHFVEKPVGEDCNIIGYMPENKVAILNINMHSRRECLDRYRVLKLNTKLSRNIFCITLQNSAKISPEVNIDGAPIVCEKTVHGLMLLHAHKEIKQNHPIPVLYIGTESFWIQSRALGLKTVHFTSAALFIARPSLKLVLFCWIKVHERFYQNIYS